MYVGTQFHTSTNDDYRVFAQLGVDHICGHPPGSTRDWTADTLLEFKEHVESFGLTLDMIPLPLGSTEISESPSSSLIQSETGILISDSSGSLLVIWKDPCL